MNTDTLHCDKTEIPLMQFIQLFQLASCFTRCKLLYMIFFLQGCIQSVVSQVTLYMILDISREE